MVRFEASEGDCIGCGLDVNAFLDAEGGGLDKGMVP